MNELFAGILPNGIELPDAWPPRRGAEAVVSGEPMPVPYLKNPPAVIPIDVGRQLLVETLQTLPQRLAPGIKCGVLR